MTGDFLIYEVFLDEEKEVKVGHTLRSLVYISQSFLMGFFKNIFLLNLNFVFFSIDIYRLPFTFKLK